jgi:hypothetical protein
MCIPSSIKPLANRFFDSMVNDIRQLSGYARDVEVLKEPDYEVSEELPVPDCIIVSPDTNVSDDIDTEKLKGCAIKQFYKFYKYGVRLPEKGNSG